jgi:alanine dehydrogenase
LTKNVKRREAILASASTLPFALALADKGWRKALKDDPHLRAGLNVHDGKLTCEPVAAAHGLAYTPAESVLGAPA